MKTTLLNFPAVIFDLDGTLIDSLEDIADSMNAVLTSRGFSEHPFESYRTFVGEGVKTLVRRALPEGYYSEETIEECVLEMRAEYQLRWADKTRPYDGIPGVLDELFHRGIKLNVFSNKPGDFTRMTVGKFFGEDKFQQILGVGPSVPAKPNPAGAFRIAESLELPPGRFLFFGDTNIDMRTARKAGMIPVGVLWGFRSMEELKDAGAKEVLRNPEDILKFFPKRS